MDNSSNAKALAQFATMLEGGDPRDGAATLLTAAVTVLAALQVAHPKVNPDEVIADTCKVLTEGFYKLVAEMEEQNDERR